MTNLAANADALLAAHQGETLLVLANAWDVASARRVEAAGFPVLATSSRAVAMVLGVADNDSSDPDLIFDHLGRMAAAVDRPLTADLEAGYRLPPPELVERMASAGIVGCNLEDTDHHGDGTLVDPERHAAYLEAVREAADALGFHVVVNARIDCFIRHQGDDAEQLSDGIRRAKLYLAAGADCVYPIALADRERISAFVDAVPGPVNIQARRDGLDLDELERIGVRRVSLASGLFTLTNDFVDMALSRLAAGGLSALWQAMPE